MDPQTVLFRVLTDGLASNGLVFSQQTGGSEPQYSDEHELVSIEWDFDCGAWDHLEQVLTTGVPPSEAVVNQSTGFECGDGVPAGHNDDTLTYAFRVYDLDQELADCIVAGHDPQGLIDDTYQRATDPLAMEELSACDVGVLTY